MDIGLELPYGHFRDSLILPLALRPPVSIMFNLTLPMGLDLERRSPVSVRVNSRIKYHPPIHPFSFNHVRLGRPLSCFRRIANHLLVCSRALYPIRWGGVPHCTFQQLSGSICRFSQSLLIYVQIILYNIIWSYL